MSNEVIGILFVGIFFILGGVITLVDPESMMKSSFWWIRDTLDAEETNSERSKAAKRLGTILGVFFLIAGALCLLGSIVVLIVKS